MINALSKAARLIGLCCFFWVHTEMAAQSSLAQGKAVDADTREPIIGLLVCIKGTTNCTFTNDLGEFALNTNSPKDSLLFQGMGYFMLQKCVFLTPDDAIYGIKQNTNDLGVIQVEAFSNKRNQLSSDAPVVLKQQSQFKNLGDNVSLQNAINTVPGVVLESRGNGGSQRINIRGSFLRSPTAVRNVKMYLDGVPISSPDGTSPLELMDVFDLNSMEVIKGPAGSMYGSGTGGVVLFRSKSPATYQTSAQTGLLLGANNLMRSTSSVEHDRSKWGIRVSHIAQSTDGYREQEFNRKQQATLSLNFRPSAKLKYHFLSTYFNGHLGLPGALTKTEAELNPRQAVAFSKNGNASLYRTRLFNMLSQTWKINGKIENVTGVYFHSTVKRNPYGTSLFSSGYKDEGANGAGVRTEFRHNLMNSKIASLTANYGAEIQTDRFRLDEYANDKGRAGQLKYYYNADYNSQLLFAQLSMNLGTRFSCNAGGSWNHTTHFVKSGTLTTPKPDSTISWPANFLPRVAMSFKLDSLIYVHGSISEGVSNPTIFEQIDPSFIYNWQFAAPPAQLNPERGVNYELSLKGKERFSGIVFELTAYQLNLTNAILPRDTSIFPFVIGEEVQLTYYVNGGSAIQRGAELMLQRNFTPKSSSWWNSLNVIATATLQDFRFNDYSLNDVSYNNKRFPGTPGHTATLGAQLTCFNEHLMLSVQDYWFDKAPLNMNNSVYLPAYHLMNVKAEGQWNVLNGFLTIIAGVGYNNVLNTEYTSFANLNNGAGRFYNPMQLGNAYGSLTLKANIR